MDLKRLATMHRSTSRSLSGTPIKELLLWYADLSLVPDERRTQVSYHCPTCGTSLSMDMEPFLHIGLRADMRCPSCWGDEKERGGE